MRYRGNLHIWLTRPDLLKKLTEIIEDKDGVFTVCNRGDSPKAEANAKRLASCWNACERSGLSDEKIRISSNEASGHPDHQDCTKYWD